MDLETVIDTVFNEGSQDLVRTSAMFRKDQVEAVERMVGGKRGRGNHAFAGMMRVVIDIGLKTIENSKSGKSRKDKTSREVAKHGRDVLTAGQAPQE